MEDIEKIIQHLESMCDSPCEIKVISSKVIEDNAQFVLFEFDEELQAAVYYPTDDILFTPVDWESGHPTTPAEIDKYNWHDSAGDEAIVLNGLPRLFTSVRDDARKTFGAKVKAIRKELDLTGEKLAKLSGLTQSNIARIESGRYNVTLDTITRLSAALGEQLI